MAGDQANRTGLDTTFGTSPQGNAESGGASQGQLLRRADWRFLLPEPVPGRTAVFASGLLAEAVRTVATESVEGRSAAAGECRLAVLGDPSHDEAAAAFTALSADGACYSEWTAWRVGGPRGVRARLKQAGFTDVRVYWPVPNLATCRAWFEVRPATRRYRHVVSDVLESGATGRFLGPLLSLTADIVLSLGLMPTLCAVAHKPNAEGNPLGSSTVDLPDRILERIAETERVSPADCLFVTRAGGTTIDNKMSWPVYEGAKPELRWIAKAPRTESSTTLLANERDALALLAQRPPVDGDVIAPHLVFAGDINGVLVLVQSAVPGVPLTLRARLDGFETISGDVTKALVALAGQPALAPRDVWWDRIMEPQLVRLAGLLDSLGEHDLVPALRQALAPLGDLPLVIAHNDCTPWNATLAGRRLALFDWEEHEAQGLPLADLHYLLANIAFVLDGIQGHVDAVNTYERLIFGTDDRATVFGTRVATYAAAVGLRTEDIALVRLAMWVRHAAWDMKNLILEKGRSPERVLTSSVCLPMIRAELAWLEASGAGHQPTTQSTSAHTRPR